MKAVECMKHPVVMHDQENGCTIRAVMYVVYSDSRGSMTDDSMIRTRNV